jgi:glucose/arabinose dehydrogenase
MDPDGSHMEIFAKGIRNTVGFDWHPDDRALWFTDNGRDWMGDNRPPDELNRAAKSGMHFGYPYCHGLDITDSKFFGQRSCQEFTPPIQELGPLVAALGMLFYTGKIFPEEYLNQIFMAEHGSWNRTNPIGYRITLVRLERNRAVSYTTFIDGWLQNGQAWGSPVDIIQLGGGSLLVSDDSADVIYRISYQGE